MNKMKS